MTVAFFASSSSRIDNEYSLAAGERRKAACSFAGMDVVFGGGGIGLMGRLADSVLSNNGSITGVIPGFMKRRAGTIAVLLK